MSPDSPQRDLRLWPGIVLAALLIVFRYLAVLVAPAAALFFAPVAGLVLGLLIVVWWLAASRAPAAERWIAAIAILVAGAISLLLLHPTVAQSAGGLLFPIYAVPLLGLLLVGWAVVARGLSEGWRRGLLVIAVAAAFLPFTLLQSPGMYGTGQADFDWRWSKTAEERLVASGDAAGSSGGAAMGEIRWPGFRGPDRNSTLSGTNIEVDWEAAPPEELWRRAVGPSWSSFAVAGDVLYTQEQLGEREVVSAYRLSTGEPVWQHADEVRFWEAMGGVGPRATPTVDGDRVYAVGATGLLNALDAATGTLQWSRDLVADTGAAVPTWGISGSPLVLDDLVIVTASGVMAAYDVATGEPIWSDVGTTEGEAYTSPQLVTVGGIRQVVLLSPDGAAGISHRNGSVIWQHARSGSPIVQPFVTADGGLLMGTTGATGGTGVAKLSIGHGPPGWVIEEAWASNRLKPYFNDFVVHEGYAYGFDGAILAAVDTESGKRAWKGGRYGHGQLLLLADQDLLLVLSEQGDLVLVSATPDGHEEIAKFPALDSKTWNHPVLLDNLLLVRNAEEMVAFRLATGA